MLIDSHCHLEFPEFAPQIDAVLARAADAGVGLCVTIGTTLKGFPQVEALARRFGNVYCSVGIHPHEAKVEPIFDAGPLLGRAEYAKVIGIGETGLDYYYEHSPRDDQIRNFRAHIAAARESGLPLIVHTRDAEDDTIDILSSEMSKGAYAGVIHCFTGTPRLAQAALELGFLISASGIATFRKSEELRATLARVPLDRLLVETDAPYLAPMPYRGKPNEPAYVVNTAKVLAERQGRELRCSRRSDHGQFLSPVFTGGAAVMSRHMEITILGSGFSGGVPRVGGPDGAGDWGACDPAEPRNRRRRCSVLVQRKSQGGVTAVLVGHLARSARATSGRPGRRIWTAFSSAMTTPTSSTASTTCARWCWRCAGASIFTATT